MLLITRGFGMVATPTYCILPADGSHQDANPPELIKTRKETNALSRRFVTVKRRPRHCFTLLPFMFSWFQRGLHPASGEHGHIMISLFSLKARIALSSLPETNSSLSHIAVFHVLRFSKGPISLVLVVLPVSRLGKPLH
jgi:hypothetical protein